MLHVEACFLKLQLIFHCYNNGGIILCYFIVLTCLIVNKLSLFNHCLYFVAHLNYAYLLKTLTRHGHAQPRSPVDTFHMKVATIFSFNGLDLWCMGGWGCGWRVVQIHTLDKSVSTDGWMDRDHFHTPLNNFSLWWWWWWWWWGGGLGEGEWGGGIEQCISFQSPLSPCLI